MKLNFILPFFAPMPGGGVKIMYEYANRMSLMGHDVVVYHNQSTPHFYYPKLRPLWLRKVISFIKYNNHPKPNWFTFDDKVKFKFIDTISNNSIRDADATITTWWSLVEPLKNLTASKGKKVNLIQGYEIWDGNEDLVHKSYNYENVTNVVISDFLYNKVKEYNFISEPILTTLAIDTNVFNVTNNIENRNPLSICMLYGENDNVKGTIYGLKAFEKLKTAFPELEVELFGVEKRPDRIPSWIKYNYNSKKLNSIYNRNAIFLAPSITEGWALPPTEAMACGCVVVSTNIPGHRHVNNYMDAITIIPEDVDDIVEKITVLLNDNNLRIKLAKKSKEFVAQYCWESVLDKFINVVTS
jgi:glycosyltransferase involved in cell wall biosynthesis